jgi:hypothetical protein
MRHCYNCGIEISRKTRTETIEHIPMQGLFDGYQDTYKKNRITVPSCFACNNSSAALDEEFRNWIGVVTDIQQHDAIVSKTSSSIFKYKKAFHRVMIDVAGNIGISFKGKVAIDYSKKVFKGLYYHRYKHPLPQTFKIVIDFNQTEKVVSKPFIDYLLQNFSYKSSGHEDIFKYILQPLRFNTVNPSKADLVPTATDSRFMALMIFNKTFASMAFAYN